MLNYVNKECKSFIIFRNRSGQVRSEVKFLNLIFWLCWLCRLRAIEFVKLRIGRRTFLKVSTVSNRNIRQSQLTFLFETVWANSEQLNQTFTEKKITNLLQKKGLLNTKLLDHPHMTSLWGMRWQIKIQ